MEKLEIYQNGFTELSKEDCQNIEGGSEFSEAVFRTIGGFVALFINVRKVNQFVLVNTGKVTS